MVPIASGTAARLLRLLAWAASVAVLASCTRAPPVTGPRVALVIGNGAYENATPLVNPPHDAEDMCAALRQLRFRTLCHVNVRSREEFDQRVQDYVALLVPGSVGVFYYSGHGVQAGDANFLIPTRAQPASATQDPTRVLYGVQDLFVRLRLPDSAFQLVVLDACRSDLFKGSASPGAPSRSTLVRSLETVARAGNGLRPILDAPPNTIVLYATASRDTAFDGEGRNGPLTKHILQHIATRGVVVEDFLKNVTQGVISETERSYGRRQTPYIYGSFGGRFCFNACPGEIPPGPLTGF